MNKIASAPHFEFRLFSQNLGLVTEAIEASCPVEESDKGLHTYLLSATSPAQNQIYNVKIRNDKLDLKVLRRQHRGLEQWRPYMQLEFPLTAAFLHEFLFSWLEVEPPPLTRSSYNADQLLYEVVTPSACLRPVQIYKQRRHYKVNGCQVELASLLLNDWLPVDTLAVEAVDAERVIHTLKLLDLAAATNTNYLVGLSQWLGQNGTEPLPVERGNGNKYRKLETNACFCPATMAVA